MKNHFNVLACYHVNMITKRIIACLDIANGKVVKGAKFGNHDM